MFPRLPARATFVVDTKQRFWFCSETFCVRNKCFPVCAAQETSWATMCPQQSSFTRALNIVVTADFKCFFWCICRCFCFYQTLVLINLFPLRLEMWALWRSWSYCGLLWTPLSHELSLHVRKTSKRRVSRWQESILCSAFLQNQERGWSSFVSIILTIWIRVSPFVQQILTHPLLVCPIFSQVLSR